MLDVERIKREVEEEGTTFVLSRDSAESFDLDAVRGELRAAGLSLYWDDGAGAWLARSRFVELSERAQRCFCDGAFNPFSALKLLPLPVAVNVCALMVGYAVEGQGRYYGSVLDAVCSVIREELGEETVEEVQAYMRGEA